MKKYLAYILGVMLPVWWMAACTEKNEPQQPEIVIDDLELNHESLKLDVGDTVQLVAEPFPEEVSTKNLLWEVDNEEVVSLSASGELIALNPGTARVSATLYNKKATCLVDVQGIVLSAYSVTCAVGETFTLTAELKGIDGGQSVYWDTNDYSALWVDEAGVCRALKKGEVEVLAYTGDGAYVSKCKVIITDLKPEEGIGDILYADGSRSKTLEAGKTPVGIVIWNGDPTASDPMLKRDYPGCTHGIAMALNHWEGIVYMRVAEYEQFQAQYSDYSIYTWAAQYIEQSRLPFTSLLQYQHPLPVCGYNNTLLLQAYNADPANAAMPLAILETLKDFDRQPRPKGASPWYIPSIKELSLICSGEFNPVDKRYGERANHYARYFNTILNSIPGSDALYYEKEAGIDATCYWSSSITFKVKYLTERLVMYNGSIGNDYMDRGQWFRPVFAF